MNHQSKAPAQSSQAIDTLIEKHRVQWLRMINQLQAAQAPADQIDFCRVQLIRLQGLRKG